MVDELATPVQPRSRSRVARVLLGLSIFGTTGAALAVAVLHPEILGGERVESLTAANATVVGRVTSVGARVADVVAKVFVEEGQTVAPGEVLVRLDEQSLQLTVDDAEAAYAEAEAQLEQLRDNALIRAKRAAAGWQPVVEAQQEVRRQIAHLRTAVANVKLQEAQRELAQRQYDRAVELAKQRTITSAELDERSATLDVAKANVEHATAEMLEARVVLGLPPADNPLDMPSDFEERAEVVQTAFARWYESILGAKPLTKSPSQDLRKLLDLARQGHFETPSIKAVESLSAVKLASAHVTRAHEALKQARLALSYAEIRAPIAGRIADLALRPGQQVRPGQELMSIGSLTDLWIEAHFERAVVEQLRVGQQVAIHAASHPSRMFTGRVSGLSPRTPAQAAAGAGEGRMLVPVRIDLVAAKLPELPLAAGLEVTAIVDLAAPPSGSLAGEPLESIAAAAPPARRAEPAE